MDRDFGTRRGGAEDPRVGAEALELDAGRAGAICPRRSRVGSFAGAARDGRRSATISAGCMSSGCSQFLRMEDGNRNGAVLEMPGGLRLAREDPTRSVFGGHGSGFRASRGAC